MATHSSNSCLGNSVDRGAWWVTVHGVTRVGHDLVTKHHSTFSNQRSETEGDLSASWCGGRGGVGVAGQPSPLSPLRKPSPHTPPGPREK